MLRVPRALLYLWRAVLWRVSTLNSPGYSELTFVNRLGCAPSSATCCGSGYCKEGKKCCESNGENYCADDCDAPEQDDDTLPTIIFPDLDNFMQEARTASGQRTHTDLKESFSKTCAEESGNAASYTVLRWMY
jgi:hypothetical protein